MKKLSFLIVAFIYTISTFGNTNNAITDKQEQKPLAADSSKKIIFIDEDFSAALKKAAKEHKYLFVDAYASWCGPCKLLKATTFKNRKAAAFFNKNFVNVSVDMEKGQGPALAAAWQLEGYPTLIIFSSEGKPVLGSVGYLGANDLIKFGEKALKAK
jgi:thioredoxin 1